MIKQFVKDTGIYGISGLLSKGIAIFLVPVYTKILTPNDYGIIDVVAVIYSIVAVTVPLEISQAVARFLADERNNILHVRKVSSIGFFLTLFSFLVFGISSFLFRDRLTILVFEDIKYTNLFNVVILNMFFTGLFYFVQNQLRWTLKPVKYAITSIFYIILSLGFSILFVVVLRVGINGVFYSYLIASISAFAVGYYYTRKDYTFSFDRKIANRMLRFSLPLVPSGVGVYFLNTGQRILIKGLMTFADLGVFAVAKKITSLLNMGFQSVQNSIIPLVYQNINGKTTTSDLAKIFRYLTFFLLLFIITISLFAREILIIMTAPAYLDAYKIVPMLLIAEGFIGLQRTFSVGLSVAKRTDIQATITIVGSVVSIAISYLFIYFHGLVGAAGAYLLQSIILFIIQLLYSQKYYHVRYEWKSASYGLLYTLLVILICNYGLMSLNTFFSITIKVLFIVGYFYLSIIHFNLLTKKELSALTYKISRKIK